jgi:hypothetical protein
MPLSILPIAARHLLSFGAWLSRFRRAGDCAGFPKLVFKLAGPPYRGPAIFVWLAHTTFWRNLSLICRKCLDK